MVFYLCCVSCRLLMLNDNDEKYSGMLHYRIDIVCSLGYPVGFRFELLGMILMKWSMWTSSSMCLF
jgi:hypothetical protein